ncbi:hypothetical protein, partial [Acinetobacter indicus]|uniref:hypothetical protein n=1 Tax=Acinetobacter indicus TaxID=756892 RepID=UPI002578C5D0
SSQKWLSDGRACSRVDSKCSDKDIKNERIYIHSFLLHFSNICLTDWHYGILPGFFVLVRSV